MYKFSSCKMNKYYIFFGNLANPLKMDIIQELKEKPSSVLELAKKLNIEQSKLSHALKSLKCCSIVNVERKGKKRIYSLNKETILPMLDIIDKHETKFCKGKCMKGIK
jgi:DNA-binding transcriptional ArsR family regulator